MAAAAHSERISGGTLATVGPFLRADAESLRDWLERRPAQMVWFCLGAVLVGSGIYGAVMGSWREPFQALYTGIKLPLVIILTTLGNGLLNGMLAPLLGLNVSFRKSMIMVLISFAFASL